MIYRLGDERNAARPDGARRGHTIEQVHQEVYAQLEAKAPTTAVRTLTQGSRYRRELRRSTDVFAFQLPFYVSKPLYCWIGSGLVAAGVSSVMAPYAISAICFGLIGILLPLFAIRAGARPAIAAAVATLAVWLPESRELGALATPDALATALVVLGAALSLTRVRIAALPLAAAVLARPDAVILALGVLAAAWWNDPSASRAREVVASCAVMSVLAALVLPLSGGYDWPTVMRQTFIERVVDEVGLHKGLSIRDYFDALSRGLRGHMTNHVAHFLPFLVLFAFGVYCYVKGGRSQSLRALVILLIAIWGATALRFLAIPLLADRFFAAAYVCTLALTSALASRSESDASTRSSATRCPS